MTQVISFFSKTSCNTE